MQESPEAKHLGNSEYRRVACASTVPMGAMIAVETEVGEIVICHTNEGWFALQNLCTHAYAKLHEGRLRGVRLICPLHGASFDCRTGAVLGPPAVAPLKVYAIRVTGDNVEIALDAEPPPTPFK
jgi:3-phenylpropionate/trans-cinnamate dioxygenase ferredoxin subunit